MFRSNTEYDKRPFLPRTRPLPAPIANARSMIELPVLKNKVLNDRRRGEERRRIRTKMVQRFIMKSLALGFINHYYDCITSN